jgi:hypothetical protein
MNNFSNGGADQDAKNKKMVGVNSSGMEKV